MSKRSSKSKRRSKALPALGFAGVSLSMASGACASTGEAMANTPPTSQSQSHEIFLGEEEISDVSLATFYVFDKENAGAPPLAQQLRLAPAAAAEVAAGWRRGTAAVAVVARLRRWRWSRAAEAVGCGGVHVGLPWLQMRRLEAAAGGGCGCSGCSGPCWIWTPLGWVYTC